MLGYDKGPVIQHFKNTLPIRYYYYYYLLFGIQNLREADESAMGVMTKRKFDKWLADQISTPYMSLKTYLLKSRNTFILIYTNC